MRFIARYDPPAKSLDIITCGISLYQGLFTIGFVCSWGGLAFCCDYRGFAGFFLWSYTIGLEWGAYDLSEV